MSFVLEKISNSLLHKPELIHRLDKYSVICRWWFQRDWLTEGKKKKKKPTHLTSVGYSLQLLHNRKIFSELRRVSLILKVLMCGDSCVAERHRSQFLTSPSSEVRKPETFCAFARTFQSRKRGTNVDRNKQRWMKACGSDLSAVFSQADPACRSPLVSVSATATSTAGASNVNLGGNPVFWYHRMLELKDFNSDMSSYVPACAGSVSAHYNLAAFCCPAHFLLSKNTGNLKSKIWSSIKPLNVFLSRCFCLFLPSS